MSVLRICFFGDSVTIGTGDVHCAGWPNRLSALETMRNGHDISCYNLGVRAETSEDIARRWEMEARPRLPDHVDGRLVFSFGLNDMADFNGAGVRVPVERSLAAAEGILAKAQAWKPVLWFGPTPVRVPPPSITPGPGVTYTFDRDRVREVNAAYQELAAKLHIPYLDLHTALEANPDWGNVLAAGDGVHPTGEGYEMIATLIQAFPAWRHWLDR